MNVFIGRQLGIVSLFVHFHQQPGAKMLSLKVSYTTVWPEKNRRHKSNADSKEKPHPRRAHSKRHMYTNRVDVDVDMDDDDDDDDGDAMVMMIDDDGDDDDGDGDDNGVDDGDDDGDDNDGGDGGDDDDDFTQLFYTHTHTQTMTHRNSYAQKLLKTAVFTRTRANFYAQNAFTHTERFYTQRTLLHTDACTRCRFHTGTHTHTRAKTFTNKCLSATHRCFDTNGFSQKACRHRCFVRQAHLDPHGCFYTRKHRNMLLYRQISLHTRLLRTTFQIWLLDCFPQEESI